jgi:hypothetical protein
MLNDSATLQLQGEKIPLGAFADAMLHFRGLIVALSGTVPGGRDVDWFVADLVYGSAQATIRGEVRPGREAVVDQVIRAYDRLGAHLDKADLIIYEPRVVKEARALTGILNGQVDGLLFQTALHDWIIRKPRHEGKRVSSPWSVVGASEAYGAIEGRVQTLTNRGGLRFTMYDTLDDRAVSCYVSEGQEHTMVGIWGKRVLVEGLISREPVSGRPVAVRQITSITELPERGPGSFRDARGIIPLRPGGLLPEEAVRRVRDA